MSEKRERIARKPSRSRVIFDWVVGLTLLGLGVIGLVVPILQGVVLIVAGLAVLSSHSKWARAIFERLRGAGRNVRQKIRQRREDRAERRRAAPESTDREG